MKPLPSYPKILDAKEWQRHKGTVAQMKGKTDIGEGLTATASEYKLFARAASEEALEKARSADDVQKVLAAVLKAKMSLCDLIDDLQKQATKTATEYKASKLVDKGTREYVEKIAKGLESFRGEVLKWSDDEYVRRATALMQGKLAVVSLLEGVKKLPSARQTVTKQLSQLGEQLKKELAKDETVKDKTVIEKLEKTMGSLYHKFCTEVVRTLSGDLQHYCDANGSSKAAGAVLKDWLYLGNNATNRVYEIGDYDKKLMKALDDLKKALKSDGFNV